MGAAHPGQCIGAEVMLGEEDSTDDECTERETLASNTVIIFDWDDTLLCSSAIHHHRWCRREMRKLERYVKRALRAAMRLGETLIVTNGNATWVEDSVRKYMPGLLPLLARVSVVSARASFENQYPGDPFMWKRAAFEHLLTKARHFPAAPGLNLVVFGDQFPEIDAAHYVAWLRGDSTELKAACPDGDSGAPHDLPRVALRIE